MARRCALLLLICLAGCGRTGPASDLDDYQQRLARVLDQPVPPATTAMAPRLPPLREFRQEIPRESIDILEFFRISRCELHQLVAERNSNLGIMAAPSQRLVYEVNFLRVGYDCLQAIDEDQPSLRENLAEVLDRKREALPLVIWKATLGGDEFRDFWKPGSSDPPEAFAGDGEVVYALAQLRDDVARWLGGNYEISSSRLENQLDLIRQGDGGVQMKAWDLLANELGAASRLVDERLARRPLCFQAMKTPTADIFNNLVRSLFVGKIQVWAAGLNSRYYRVFPLVRELETLLAGAEPPAYREWRTSRDNRLAESTGALGEHVKALTPLFEQCNLLPSDNR
ncbi:MAG: DUF3080 family protein [Pseudomonadota bacterium]